EVVHHRQDRAVGPVTLGTQVILQLTNRCRLAASPQPIHDRRFQITERAHRHLPPAPPTPKKNSSVGDVPPRRPDRQIEATRMTTTHSHGGDSASAGVIPTPTAHRNEGTASYGWRPTQSTFSRALSAAMRSGSQRGSCGPTSSSSESPSS